jgi:hypothetical protein
MMNIQETKQKIQRQSFIASCKAENLGCGTGKRKKLHLCYENILGDGGIAPLILNLGIM